MYCIYRWDYWDYDSIKWWPRSDVEYIWFRFQIWEFRELISLPNQFKKNKKKNRLFIWISFQFVVIWFFSLLLQMIILIEKKKIKTKNLLANFVLAIQSIRLPVVLVYVHWHDNHFDRLCNQRDKWVHRCPYMNKNLW